MLFCVNNKKNLPWDALGFPGPSAELPCLTKDWSQRNSSPASVMEPAPP